MNQYCLGIDPGVTGAIAVLDANTGQLVDLVDIPSIKPGKRSKVDEVGLGNLLRPLSPLVDENVITHACVELSGTRPGESPFTAGQYMQAAGVVQGALGALQIGFDTVPAAVWKKTFSLLKRDKDAARSHARRLYPTAELHLVKHHNRAEALLIARWAWLKQCKEAA